jgi:hypothetical protein
MPRERLAMRKIRDVLRLSADGLSKRAIAGSLDEDAHATDRHGEEGLVRRASVGDDRRHASVWSRFCSMCASNGVNDRAITARSARREGASSSLRRILAGSIRGPRSHCGFDAAPPQVLRCLGQLARGDGLQQDDRDRAHSRRSPAIACRAARHAHRRSGPCAVGRLAGRKFNRFAATTGFPKPQRRRLGVFKS